MNKRVHEIAKQHGLAPKELLEKLKAAGVEVKAASSSVDEAVALRVLGNGGAPEVDGNANAAPAQEKAAKPKPAADGAKAAAKSSESSDSKPAAEKPATEKAKSEKPAGKKPD